MINLRSLGLPLTPGFVSGIDTVASGVGADVAALSQPSDAPSLGTGAYPAIVAFGDSLSDVGNDYAASLHLVPSAPYFAGHFSNGPIWAEDLAGEVGAPVPTPSLLGGTDFAYGGAETGQETLHQQTPLDLPSQLLQFALSDAGAGSRSGALYTLSIGSNDVLDATSADPSDPAAATADIGQAVTNEVDFLSGLVAAGARHLLVLDVPDIGRTPQLLAQGTEASQLASSLAAQYDAALSGSLASLVADSGVDLHLVDTYGLLDAGISDPARFGLTNVTQPVWTGNYTDPASGVLNATGAAQGGYLFFDGLHPTATGHAILASAAAQSLTAVA